MSLPWMPFAPPRVTYGTLFSVTLNTNVAGQGGYSRRQHVATGAYLLSVNSAKIRLTFTPPTSGNNTPMAGVYVGHKGASAPNFDGGQVAVTFGGSSTTTLTAGGSVVVSDVIDFAFDYTKDLIVSFNTPGTADVRYLSTGSANYEDYSKAATSGEGGTTTVSGYTGTDIFVTLSKIEIRT